MPKTSCKASALVQRSSVISSSVLVQLSCNIFFVFIWCCCVWLGTELQLIFHLHMYANTVVRKAAMEVDFRSDAAGEGRQMKMGPFFEVKKMATRKEVRLN